MRAYSYAELMRRPKTERTSLVSPWVRQGESVMIWAASGVGKTMLTLTLAIAMAGGGSFAGWSCETPRKVLLIDGEMHLQDLQDRLEMLTAAVTGVDRDALGRNLTIIARQAQPSDSQEFYDISSIEGQDRLLKRVAFEGSQVVILDNYTTLSDGLADENDAGAFKPVMRLLMGLKRQDVSVILVHHSNKSAASYRGSTALETTFEVIIGLTRPEGAQPGNASFRLTFTKFRQKGDGTTAPRVFTLDGTGWYAAEDEADLTTRIVAAIKSCRYSTQADVAQAMGINAATVSRHLTKAQVGGFITKREIQMALAGGEESHTARKPDDDAWDF